MNLKSYLRGAGLGIMLTALILTFAGGQESRAMSDAEIRSRAKELGMTDGNEVLTDAFTEATAPSVAEVASETVPTEEVPAEVSAETVTEEAGTVAAETVSSEAASTEATVEASSSEASLGQASTEAASESASTAAETDSKDIKSADEIIEESLKDTQTTSLTSDLTGEDKSKSELLADAVESEAVSESPVQDTASGFVSIHINGGSSSTAVARALKEAGAISDAAAFDAYLCSKGYDRRLSTGDFRIPAGSTDEDIALILMRRK